MSEEGTEVKEKSGERGQGRILRWNYEIPMPEIPNVNLASLMLEVISQFGDKVALEEVDTGNSITYKDLKTTILKLSAGFTSAGIGLGDSVLLLSKNHIHFHAAAFAIMLSEATCVPASPVFTKGELLHTIRVSEAKYVITNSETAAKVEEVFAELGPDTLKEIWLIDEKDKSNRPSLNDLIKIGQETTPKKNNKRFDSTRTVALMPFSSGTTGLPKGVMLSHRNLLTYHFQGKYLMSLTPEIPVNIMERLLLVVPMYHMYGFNITRSLLCSGGRLIILNKFSPEKYLKTIEKYKITYAPIVPHIAKFLLDTSLIKKYDLSSLFVIVSTTSPITEETLDGIRDKTGKMALQGYGMTETSAVVTSNAGIAGSKPNSVGSIMPYIEAKVIDPETSEVLGEREEGELCIRGPGTALGYANNLKATSEAIDSEGWYHTGDVCYYDEDSFLFITDRYKDLIKVKGYQVAPSEIETLLLELEEIADVAVAGVPNERLGEAPRAWVVPTKGAKIHPAKLMKHVADNLAAYKQLSGGVEVTDVLPRNHLGKILRRQLRKSYVEATRSKL